MLHLPDITGVVASALAEDLGVPAETFLSGEGSPELLARDVTSSTVVGTDSRFVGRVVARQDCVVCGLEVAATVFETLSRAAGLFDPVEFFPLVAEGSRVTAGTAVAEVDGLSAAVLCAERTALDFMMILSGIATTTAEWVSAAGPSVAVCDTRKTLPGMRALSKYAVTVGGGTNHRAGLYDMVLVKDNHLRHASIPDAVERARSAGLVIEVEADTAEQAVEAVRSGADMVLLDNMDNATLKSVLGMCRDEAEKRGTPVLLEASGSVRLERVAELAETGVDRISSSALTLTAPVDFGLDEA